MKKENIRQHFIPQCYLKNFSENKKFVYVYSKRNTKKGYAQSIAKTACIDYFYSIPEKYLDLDISEDIDSNFIEKKILAENIEKIYSKLLNKIISAASEWSISKEEKEVFNKRERDLFASLIAIQFLRMPNIRNKYWNAQQKIQRKRDEIAEAFKSHYGNIDVSKIIALKRDDDYAPVMHSELFLDEELITETQTLLIKKNWRYRVTKNDVVFTSDNPILLNPHLKNQTAFYEGFGMKGVEIIFPISRNIILTIWDDEYFPNYSSENNKFSFLTDAELRQYNCYQYIWANDEVYSSKNDFKLIRLLKEANGYRNTEIFKKTPTNKS